MTGQNAVSYKTGDKHPIHNLMAFVEYDEQGEGWWTSIATDPTAPFRLAAESKSGRQRDMHVETDNVDRSGDSQRSGLPPEAHLEPTFGIR